MLHRKVLILAALTNGDDFAAMTSKLRIVGDKGEVEATVLFDTGAAQSFILRSVAEKIATIVKLAEPMVFRLANGKTTVTVTDVAIVTVGPAGKSITDTFLIIENAVQDIILGESTMRRFGLKIDMARGAVYAEITQQKEHDMWKKFLAAIGITVADEVTEEKAAELVKAKIDAAKPAVASPKILAVLELKEDATEDQVRGAILALKSPGNVVSAEKFAEIEKELGIARIERAVAAARAEGKITPAEEPTWLKDLKEGAETLATFETFIVRRGKVVPIDVKLPEKKTTDAAAAIDETQAAINKQLGVSEETFKKYNAAK